MRSTPFLLYDDILISIAPQRKKKKEKGEGCEVAQVTGTAVVRSAGGETQSEGKGGEKRKEEEKRRGRLGRFTYSLARLLSWRWRRRKGKGKKRGEGRIIKRFFLPRVLKSVSKGGEKKRGKEKDNVLYGGWSSSTRLCPRLANRVFEVDLRLPHMTEGRKKEGGKGASAQHRPRHLSLSFCSGAAVVGTSRLRRTELPGGKKGGRESPDFTDLPSVESMMDWDAAISEEGEREKKRTPRRCALRSRLEYIYYSKARRPSKGGASTSLSYCGRVKKGKGRGERGGMERPTPSTRGGLRLFTSKAWAREGKGGMISVFCRRTFNLLCGRA